MGIVFIARFSHVEEMAMFLLRMERQAGHIDADPWCILPLLFVGLGWIRDLCMRLRFHLVNASVSRNDSRCRTLGHWVQGSSHGNSS